MDFFSLLAGSETLEKPLVSEELALPESVTLAGDFLQFSAKIEKRVSSNAAGLLTGFAALAKADGPAVLRHAKRFGPLGLCGKHSFPVLHAGMPCWPKRDRYGLFMESTVAWRRYAKRVGAMLSIAAALRREEPGEEEDWRTIVPSRAKAIPNSKQRRNWLLALAVNGLLENAQPKVMIYPDDSDHLQIVFAGVSMIAGLRLLDHLDPHATKDETLWLPSAGNLLAAIALQTAMAVASYAGLAKCADCGDLFRPGRALPLNKLHFCPNCGRRASRKHYMRRVRNPEQKKQYEMIRRNVPGRER